MNIKSIIGQAAARAGKNYSRKRDTDEFKRSLKNWRKFESPERVQNRSVGLGMGRELESTARAFPSEAASPLNPLERVIEASQLISSIYLSLGAERMRAVARIISESNRGFGTGFLISPRLLMTNNHVLEDALMAARCRVQFDYVRAIDGTMGLTEIYRLLPNEFFLTAEVKDGLNLDYTIVAIEATNTEGKQLSRRGFIPLVATSGKLILGDLANIIQHPGGEAQQVALRDSKVVTPLDDFIRYEADTQPGSSGSPVFNDLWQVAALHHSGVPEEVRPGVYRLIDGGEWDTTKRLSHEDELRMAARVKWIANEGVRVSSIVRDVQNRLAGDPVKLAMFNADVQEQVTPVPEREVSNSASSQNQAPAAIQRGKPVTWTIPLRVTVQLGPDMELSVGAPSITSDVPIQISSVPSLDTPAGAPGDTDAAASRARESLAGNPDILEVRSGFLWKDGQMTDTEAVVVVVDPRMSMESADPHEALRIPRQINGVPVDITVGGATAVFRALERRADLGPEAMPIAELFQEKVPVIGYEKPTDVTLPEVAEPMEVTCHVSPDDGWPNLKEFLDRTNKTITLGMFDLTAPHIVEKFKVLGARPGFRMNLAIQMGMAGGLGKEKKNDIPEDQFIAGMGDIMGKRFRQAYVDVSGPDRTFASAYHIKVAVRDHEEFWLSSGNMQTSNQPDRSPAADKDKTFSPLKRFNREWHVIIKNKKLATIFEKFLLHDLEAAEKNPAEPPKPKDEVLLPVAPVDPEFLEKVTEPEYFGRKTFPVKAGAPVRIQPLLTPDNFLDHVISIVKSAKKTLFIQNQSLALLQPLEKNEKKFLELFETILARQEAGVEVRMIFRVMPIDEDAARATKDALVKFGFKKDRIFVLENCHTKGAIIDSKVVIIGSHNWTNQGTIANRDASLIIHDKDIAGYYEEIFLFDWEARKREPKPQKPKKKKGTEEGIAPEILETVRVNADELILGD